MAVSHYIDTFMDGSKKFWREFDIKKLSERIGGSSAEAVEAAIYFVLSFSIGFLCKKYFKFIFVCTILSLFFIKGLEYYQFITIDWSALKTVFGAGETASDFNTLSTQAFEWLKSHLLLTIASVVGFLVGYKLG